MARCNCANRKKAQKGGTDNECYGVLLSEDGDWKIGCELPPICFCPWCGETLPKARVAHTWRWQSADREGETFRCVRCGAAEKVTDQWQLTTYCGVTQ